MHEKRRPRNLPRRHGAVAKVQSYALADVGLQLLEDGVGRIPTTSSRALRVNLIKGQKPAALQIGIREPRGKHAVKGG